MVRARSPPEQLARYSWATKKESTTELSEGCSMEERVFQGHALLSDAEGFDQKGITPEAQTWKSQMP